MSGWGALIASFGLSASNSDAGYQSNNSDTQGIRETKKLREDHRGPHLTPTLPGPSRGAKTAQRTAQRTRAPAEARVRKSWPQSHGSPVDSGPRQAGGSSQSVSNLPQLAYHGSGGERVLGRGLRKQRSGTHIDRFTTDVFTDASQR